MASIAILGQSIVWDRRSYERAISEAVKRFMDVSGGLVLLAIFLPLMLIVGLLVRISSRGPIIFAQRRLTQGGRIFYMYKFRTMTHNAEAESGPVWAKEKDPRVTTLGKILRRTRIDELPQLLNVLIGDMSLIGPRPERPEIALELEKSFPYFRRRLKVKGGLTGLAQIQSGYAASVDTYREKLSYDLLYVSHHSFFLDLQIALKTVVVMLTGRGAR